MHFDRPVQERVADAERHGLQCEALAASAHVDPVRLVGSLADKHRDAGGAANLPGLLRVLGVWREDPLKRQLADPGRNRRGARRRAAQTVRGANRRRAIEAGPCLYFLDERQVRHLRGVALNHMLRHVFDGGALGLQLHTHTLRRASAFEQAEFRMGDWPAVIVAAGTLPRRNRLERGRGLGRGGRQRDAHGVLCAGSARQVRAATAS